MHYKQDVFMAQYPIAKRFVYHTLIFRAINKRYKERGIKSEFWTLTIDAHLLQAAIQWCMVFGSDGSNPIHWKNLSAAESGELLDDFRKNLPDETGLSLVQWRLYWDEMLEFRNKYAAHRELDYRKPVPSFDTAMDIVFYYDRWIRKVISPDTFEEPPLVDTARDLKARFEVLSRQLLEIQ